MSSKEQLEDWRERLWNKAIAAARGKRGPAVIRALRRATIHLNEVGMDDFYDEISEAKSTSGLYYAFDITWLVAFALEIQFPHKQSRKRKRSN